MKKLFSLCLCFMASVALLSAATISVSPGTGTIKAAISNASSGDVLVLAAGEYTESSTLRPGDKALTIKAADGATCTVNMGSRFEVVANFSLQNLILKGASTELLRMAKGTTPYDVSVTGCRLSGCTSKFIRVYFDEDNETQPTSPRVNNVTIQDCVFLMGTDAANAVRAFHAGPWAHLLFNGLSIKNCTFDGGKNGTGRIIYDSANAPDADLPNAVDMQGTVEVDHCTFYNSNETRGVYFPNINGTHITNCIFMNPEERANTVSYALYGKDALIENSLSWNAPIKLDYDATQKSCVMRNPYFVDADNGNFQLYKNSIAVNMGTDGTTIGDPRWGVSSENYDNSDAPYTPYKMPYTMAPTTTSIKVVWQMADESEATDALIYYGTDPDNLNQQVTSNDGWNVADEGFVHVVTLTGLQPNTRYYFTVGANATRRLDKISSTKTAPEQGTAYRIFSISDIHGNARNNWSNMQDFICNLNCDISLMNGDFVSSKGNDRNWNNYFFTPGAQFLGQVPLMSSVGNHETGDPFTYRWSSYYDYFHQFSHGEPEGDLIDPRGEAYFHFVYGNADVVMLNLNGDPSSPEFAPGSKQYQWADSVLNACDRPWIIICHHVGVYTTGYHGQWSEEPKQIAPLFEKYAAKGKHILSLSGDDHSFEHLYKDGVHYVRPGCGRDANYNQQKQLVDYKYSMFYRKVSCFSTLDMAADASKIALTAYDSVGNIFYTYDFLLDGETINPSINFTVPATEVEAQDSIKLQWYTFDPANDAVVSLYYSTQANATSVEGMTPIAENLANTVEKYVWNTRYITPKGKYYVYGAIRSGGKNYLSSNKAIVTLLEDVTPPPAPTGMTGQVLNNQYCIYWKNPTHLVHLDTLLADFNANVGSMEAVGEDGAVMNLSLENNALKCDYNLTTAWATAAAEFVFQQPVNLQQTPVLNFRLKGNGTSIPLRIVCKNMSAGHEDWWYTEKYTLESADWQDIALEMSQLQSFDWYTNSDEWNHVEGMVRISFGVSTEAAASGTFLLDDIHLSGDILPAPDYQETVVLRKDNAFPASHTDGVEVYRGTEEQCVDNTADVSRVYYYAAFAADDMGNWSAAEPSAQWVTTSPYTDLSTLDNVSNTARKVWREGVLYIEHNGTTYNLLGTAVPMK